MEVVTTADKEVWKDIKGYEGRYMVSNQGNIMSLLDNHGNPKELVISQQANRFGRMLVHLHKSGERKVMQVHRLVAEAFIENELDLPQINHIDGNPKNNRVENLEWCDASYNMRHAYRTGLCRARRTKNEEAKKAIIRSDGKMYDCAYSAAEDMCVSVCSIRDALKKRTHTCRGYELNYADI